MRDRQKALDEHRKRKKAKARSGARPIEVTKLPGRNDRCVCKSGAKFKECCLPKIREKEAELRQLLTRRELAPAEWEATTKAIEATKTAVRDLYSGVRV